MPLLPATRTPDPAAAPALRWGVIGPGEIAGDFVAALQQHTRQRVVAVGSRSAERAAAFAATYGVPNVHVGYEALVADPEVDVVYIATPHSEHTANALLAIAAGKHVLIEKPVAVTADLARTIFAAAEAAGVFAMEAMWTRFLPQTDVVAQLLEDGALGPLSLATADFAGGAAPRDPSSRLLDPAQGGGALLDLGVYVAWWAQFALGTPERSRPVACSAPPASTSRRRCSPRPATRRASASSGSAAAPPGRPPSSGRPAASRSPRPTGRRAG